MGIIQRNSLSITILSYIGIVIGCLNKVLLLPNFFTEEQVGLTNILVNLAVIYAQLSALGINFTVVKFFPFFRTADRRHNGLFFWSGVGASIGFLLFTTLFLLFREPVTAYYSQRSPLLSEYYLMLIPLGLTTLFYNFFTAWLQAFFKTVISSFLNEVLLRILITVEIGLFALGVLDFHQFVVWYVVIYFIPTVILLGYILSMRATHYGPVRSPRLKKLLSIAAVYGLWQYLGGTSNYIVPVIDQAMLAGIQSLADSGIYITIVFMVSVMQMPYRSLIKVSTPVITSYWKERNMEGMHALARKVSVLNLVAACYLFLVIWVNLDNIFTLLPSSYAAGRYVFLFLGLGRIVDMYSGLNSAILTTSRRYRYEFILSLALVFLTIGTNLLLIPLWGMNGAAIATMCSIILFDIGHWYYVRRFFGIQPFALRDGVVVLIMAAAIGISMLIPRLQFMVLDATVRTLVVTLLFGACIYLSRTAPSLNAMLDHFVDRWLRRRS